MKKNWLITIGCILIFCGCCLIFNNLINKPKNNYGYSLITNPYSSYKYITSYEEYLEFKSSNPDNEFSKELTKDDFDSNYLFYTTTYDSCSEEIEEDEFKKEDNTYKIHLDVNYKCGVCAPKYITYVYKVDKIDLKVEAYSRVLSQESCDPNVAYKPIIYIYPTKEMDLNIKLGNKDNLTYTYPQYKDSWNVRVSIDGNIYDYDTNRNYYGLYWEGLDNYKLDMSTGFVVKREDTIKFLEDKLSILGLNEYEINEFIIYWIDKLDNNYNFISFRNIEDINSSMPLIISEKPDTLIRVMMDIKPLDSYIDVKEQELVKVDRKGFTIVEWGGTIHK